MLFIIVSEKSNIGNNHLFAATISVGNGQSQLAEFTSILNMPHLNIIQYRNGHDYLENVIQNVLLHDMLRAGEEEVRIAKEKGDVSSDGIPFITVIADGAWSKRSYKTNYNALSGVAVIIGEATRKILYLGIKNKFCIICSNYDNKNEETPTHYCARNWNNSSTSMEAAIILDGFKSSLEMHGLRYTKLVGDGDSSITKKLAAEKPYGIIQVEKVECVNHLLRNLCCKLKELSKASRSPTSSKIIPLNIRKKLESSIMRFRICIKKSAEYRNMTNENLGTKILLLKKDIFNSIDHIFGDHNRCEQYFCKGAKDNEENLVPIITECGLKVDVINCLKRILNYSSSLLMNKNNNAAEQFNSLVNKFVGGKRVSSVIINNSPYYLLSTIASKNERIEYLY